MGEHKFKFGKGSGGAALSVKVTPRASRNEISGWTEEGVLKVRVTAAPANNAANEAVITLLSKALDVPKSRIAIGAGDATTQKLISIMGVSSAQVDERLREVTGSLAD
jgi:uncharacterized protein YggU (UPF0235/DUF167 family)